MAAKDPAWFEFASVVPLAATEKLGLGPFALQGASPVSRLKALKRSGPALYTAIETAGVIGGQIVSVLLWYGVGISTETLAAETPGAQSSEVSEAITRLVAAGLVTENRGNLRLVDAAAEVLVPIGMSLFFHQAVTSDELGRICRVLGIKPAPTRKHERIDAISDHFSDPEARRQVLGGLSNSARCLLEEIATVGGPTVVDPVSVGLGGSSLHQARAPRFAVSRDPSHLPEAVAALAELTRHGIVGLDAWNDALWIWREAWPLAERPLYRNWPSVPAPATAALANATLRIPPLVALAERALQHWEQSPPAVLKNGEHRLAKVVVRSTAKALGTDVATVEIIAATLLSMGLLLANVVASTGRGRNRAVERVWLPDPELRSAWSEAAVATRWLRMVDEWINPKTTGSHQLVANRHLVLWELAALEDGIGWLDDAEAGRWMHHRYASMAVDAAVVECLRDLRVLGVVAPDGPAGLSELGRRALEDPASVASADFGSAETAVVQADETIVCPPDLVAHVVERLGRIAVLESDTGARVFRLNEALITKSVQRGDSPADIVAFLEDLSSVPLPDTIRTLVGDAAARAERVRIIKATTVVVMADPVDLSAACRLKSAKLTSVSPTTAVSSLKAEKLHQILDRKGLAPTVVSVSGDELVARKASDGAADLERAARNRRQLAERHHIDGLADQADRLARQAAAARDPASKLAVSGPMAVTPILLERLRS